MYVNYLSRNKKKKYLARCLVEFRDLFSAKIIKLTRHSVLLHFLQNCNVRAAGLLINFLFRPSFFFYNHLSYWNFPFCRVFFLGPSFPVVMTWKTALQSWSSERSCEFVAESSSSQCLIWWNAFFFPYQFGKAVHELFSWIACAFNMFEKPFFVKSNMVASKPTLPLAHST